MEDGLGFFKNESYNKIFVFILPQNLLHLLFQAAR